MATYLTLAQRVKRHRDSLGTLTLSERFNDLAKSVRFYIHALPAKVDKGFHIIRKEKDWEKIHLDFKRSAIETGVIALDCEWQIGKDAKRDKPDLLLLGTPGFQLAIWARKSTSTTLAEDLPASMRTLVEDGAFVLTGNGVAEDIRCAGLKPGGAILDTTTLWRGLNTQGFLPELGIRSSLGHMAMLLTDTSCPYYDHKCKGKTAFGKRHNLPKDSRGRYLIDATKWTSMRNYSQMFSWREHLFAHPAARAYASLDVMVPLAVLGRGVAEMMETSSGLFHGKSTAECIETVSSEFWQEAGDYMETSHATPSSTSATPNDLEEGELEDEESDWVRSYRTESTSQQSISEACETDSTTSATPTQGLKRAGDLLVDSPREDQRFESKKVKTEHNHVELEVSQYHISPVIPACFRCGTPGHSRCAEGCRKKVSCRHCGRDDHHATSVCRKLHMGCKTCGYRGHGQRDPHPRIMADDFKEFEEHAGFGVLTRKRFRFPGFGFLLLTKDAGSIDYKRILETTSEKLRKKIEK